MAALQANPGRFISATQLGVTLSSLGLGAIGEPVVSRILRTPIDWSPQSWHGSIALTVWNYDAQFWVIR